MTCSIEMGMDFWILLLELRNQIAFF